MKATLKEGFLVRDIAGEQVLIGGGEQINFSKMLMLSETAAFLLKEMQAAQAPLAAQTLAQRLTETYDVSLPQAQADVEELLQQLQSLGVISVEQ